MLVAGRRSRLAALVAGTVTMLAGCGMHPGAAAVVGSQTISEERVDDVAVAVCSANLASAQASGQPAPTLPSRGAREVAVRILIETELSQQFGEAEGVEANQQQVSQAVAQNESGLAMLPDDQRADFRTALRDYTEGQLMLIEIGRRALGSGATDDQAIAEGRKQLAEYAKNLEIEVDPKFGRFEDGVFKRGGSSLSVAASDAAKAGERDQPDEAFVVALPSSQQCS